MPMTRARSVLLLAAVAWGAICASASAQISLSKTSNLNFGSMVSGPTAGSVTISVTGAVSSTGGVTLVPATTSAANFILANGPTGGTRLYIIQVPTSVTITSGANSMIVDNFDNTTPNIGLLANNASRTIGVGATLNVGANQPSGTYSGTFLMSVAFF